MISIAPAIGAGTRSDPYRPFGWDLAKTSWISLYAPSTHNPAGQIFILNHDTPIVDARLEVMGADKDDPILPARLNAINTKLGGTSLTSRSKCSDLIVELLLSGARCPILQPNAARMYEIWLAGERIFAQRAVGGGATASDDFGTDQDPVSTTSSGGTWNSGNGDWGNMQALSGVCKPSLTGLDSACAIATPAFGSNQYSQFTVTTRLTAGTLLGAITRMQGAADASCYLLQTDSGSITDNLGLVRIDFPFSFTLLTSLTVSLTYPNAMKLISNGSGHESFWAGVSLGAPFTDATYVGGQPGVHAYTALDLANVAGDDFLAADISAVTPPGSMLIMYQ